MSSSVQSVRSHPTGVTVNAIINGVAFLLTLLFWGMLFAPFMPAAVWSMIYLWKERELFWSRSGQSA
ncbi:MAG TPA: hypothetical protein DEP53_13175 [Bacteroidetes bacterium]|nr:hypothetical protein [Bacteroidota bacterium]